MDPLIYKRLAYLSWIKKKKKKPPLLKFSDYRMMGSEKRNHQKGEDGLEVGKVAIFRR